MAQSSAVEQSCPCCTRVASAMQSFKALDALVMSMMAELWALRQSVLQNREARQRYEEHFKCATAAARPILADAMEGYERIIWGRDEHSQ